MRKFYQVGLMADRVGAYERRLCEGVADFAQYQGDWELTFITPAEMRSLKALSSFDGFICRIPDRKIASILQRTARPVVDVLNQVEMESFSHVDSDHVAVGIRAADHFLSRRFRNFAFCGSGQSFLNARRDAFFAQIASECPDGHCFDYKESLPNKRVDNGATGTPVTAPDFTRLSKWLRALPRPIGVFCSHDGRAYQVLQACRRLSIKVPEEVAILGVGNDTLVCSFTSPSLSSIDLDAEGVGRLAAAVLADQMYGADGAAPLTRMVKPKELVVRPSTEMYPVDPPWLSDALVFIRRNIGKGIIAADVFQYLARSHTSVESAFRKVLGTTVQKEIMRTRMDRAARLLARTNIPINEVCSRSGFTRAQYFCNAFQHRYACSPTEYRMKEMSKGSDE